MSRPPSQEVSETALARAKELAIGLYPHQVEGIAFLLARRRSILADDMGLGKTHARALSPPVAAKKYRIASSKEGQYYELQVDGPDIVCSCRGFEFRGQCKHARTLKDVLATGDEVPEEYELL